MGNAPPLQRRAVVTVTDFKRFVASRSLSAEETELDAFVERLGG
jgi:hypothetical protein